MSFYSSLFISICITSIGIMSMYLLLGLSGIFSMGQAAFMSVGAYAAGLLAIRTGMPMIITAPIAVLVGMGVAGLIAIPVIKLRRDYVALVTISFGEAIVALLNKMTSLTGGSLGLNGIPRVMTVPLAVAIVIACLYMVLNFKKSRFGRQCFAVKSDEISAAAMGINVRNIKMTVFVLAGGFTALSGAMWAYLTTYVEPNSFGQKLSIEWIIITFIGGSGSLSGSIISAVILKTLPEILRFADNLRIIIYSVIVLLIINFRPKGLFGDYELTDIFRLIRKKLLKKGSSVLPEKRDKDE